MPDGTPGEPPSRLRAATDSDEPLHSRVRQLSTGWVLSQFGVIAAVVLVVFGAAGFLAVRQAAVDREVAHARERTVAVTRWRVEPALTDALVAGDSGATRTFDAVVRSAVLRDRVVCVKLWTAQGRIVYSDKAALEGRRFRLGPASRSTLRTGHAYAQLSSLDRPENRHQRRYGKLFEVYTLVRTPGGQPLLFETYQRRGPLVAASNVLAWSVLPAFLLAILATQVAQLPLLWRLVRRVRLGQREKTALQRRTLEASEHERRRIARELHDGLVQSLSGLSFGLAGTADRARADGRTGTAADLDAAAALTRESVTQLRNVISSIYPAALEADGLRASITDLLATAERHGLRTSMDIDEDPPVEPEVSAALYRATQEAVRNVLSHSRATTVHVGLIREARAIGVVIEDNGIGMAAWPPGHHPTPSGLQILHDIAHEVRGSLEVSPRQEGGTRFVFTLPIP